MSHLSVAVLIVLLGLTGYALGRLHGEAGYRRGYRQGYLDGDRTAWHRRHREAQATVASVLAVRPVTGDTPARQHADDQR